MTLKQFLKYYAAFLIGAPFFSSFVSYLNKDLGVIYYVLTILIALIVFVMGFVGVMENKFKPEAEDEI